MAKERPVLMPKLSIITINYNNSPGLEKTIKSVLKQSFLDYEYIVIDGGSTDESLQVLNNYNNKLSIWVSEKDTGIYNAMNKGILKCQGEYCLFLNSGDWLKDARVLQKVFSTPAVADIIYGDMIIDWGKGKLRLGTMPNQISLYQMYTDTLWHPVTFIKKRLFSLYGPYDETFKLVGDYEFFFRTIIDKKVTTQHLHLPISVFATNGLSSLPENKKLEISERTRVIQKYLTELQIETLDELVRAVDKRPTIVRFILKKLGFTR